MEEEYILKMSDALQKANAIDEELYEQYNVKRGLRNNDFTGVLAGLTNIGEVTGYKIVDNKSTPIDGKLFYRGFDTNKLANGFWNEKRFGFDETVFLLLFGNLPAKDELETFSSILAQSRDLPDNFTEDMILKIKGKDIMNMLARCTLALYALDDKADDTTVANVLKQSINLIAKFPTIIAYSYHSMNHYYLKNHLVIRHPKKKLSTAENFLYMLKGINKYSSLEAKLLDLVLVLHAEHGGGNNSSFTMRVVSSSSTDTYSAIAAALGALKGPLHGGANQKVPIMMKEIKDNVRNPTSEAEISDYLIKILKKEAFDRTGKIYGFGHAVYTISDPRTVILKEKAMELAKEKSCMDDFEFYKRVEKLAPEIFAKFKGTEKKICTNVDFYSGFVGDCIGITRELYTPLFAMSRISGLCAHRLEELSCKKRKLIRPAFKNVCPKKEYVAFNERIK